MREYIIRAAVAAVVAAAAEFVAPQKWRGYIRLAIGFMVLAILFAPVMEMKNKPLFPQNHKYELNDIPFKDAISEQLKENVERDIEERIREEFRTNAEATVEIEIDDKHNIKGVHRIIIDSRKNPQGLAERLREVYGCERIEFQ